MDISLQFVNPSRLASFPDAQARAEAIDQERDNDYPHPEWAVRESDRLGCCCVDSVSEYFRLAELFEAVLAEVSKEEAVTIRAAFP